MRQVVAAGIAGVAVFLANLSLLSVSTAADSQAITKTWAIAEFGEPLYKDGIEYWPYANPDAPVGGSIVLNAFGSFDSLNSIILKGEWPRSFASGYISDSLMVSSADELSTGYGLIAETVEYPDDKSWIIFNLRSEAHFSDGTPITADDFVFAFDTIREHGRPFLKSFFDEVDTVEALQPQRLKVTFNTKNNMKPLMKAAGFSPVSRAYWQDKDISKTYLDPQPSSGPYVISKIDPGRSLTYQRLDNYWGKDLPVNRGLNNISTIRYDYYRDLEVMVEAFKAGEIDFREENSSKRWATAYKIPEVDNKEIILATPPDNTPQGVQGYFFNLRRAPFDDPLVRQAFTELYDFETLKRTILYDQYQRIKSFFPNSDFGASGSPTEAELALLEPYREQLPAALFEQAYEPPKTDGSGRNRAQLRKAIKLFKQAGWALKNGKLLKKGEQMAVEFLFVQPDSQRTLAPYIQNLKRAGVKATLRLVDSAQYQVRLDDFDFDMTTVRLNFFPPPGPELRSYYGSEAADVRGSANMIGIKNPIADALIEKIINAPTLEALKVATRALDRVLLWNHYVVTQFYNDIFRIAYWNRFGKPERQPKYGTGFPTSWWIDAELDSKLDLKR